MTEKSQTQTTSALGEQARELKLYYSEMEVAAEQKATGNALVIYRGGVYDVREFLDRVKHPGGNELIEDRLGQDITLAMEEAGHSPNAYRMLQRYQIGVVTYARTEQEKQHVQKNKHKLKFKQELVDSINSKIDLRQPVFPQIYNANFTLEEYLTFIHDPKLLNDPPRDLRIFKSNFFEFFSKTVWFAVPLFWIPVFLMIMKYGYDSMDEPSLISLTLGFILGLFIWTFGEYFLHRWVFHIDDHIIPGNLAFCTHFLIHGIHHAFPMDRYRLVFPIPFAIVVATIVGTILCSIGGVAWGSFMMGGFGVGYVIYDINHYYLHHSQGHTDYHRDLKEYHMKHHYKDFEMGYGVSMKFWDYVFGTVPPQQV